MKTKKIFQAVGLLSLFMLFAIIPNLAFGQTDPVIGPDSGTDDLVNYWNWLWAGLQAAGTIIVGYLSNYIPGIKNIANKFYKIAAAAMVVGLFLYLALSQGTSIWELISPLIGFVTATGLIYPGILKPAGLKTE